MDLPELLTGLLQPLRSDELRALGARISTGPDLQAELESLGDRPAAMVQVLVRRWKWLRGPEPFHHLLELRPDLSEALQQVLDHPDLPLRDEDRAALRSRPGPALVELSPEQSALAAQLDAAWTALDEAGARGDEARVQALRAKILELRRAIRAGPALKAGEILGEGRYTLTERLGHGGYATVWGAWDRRERRPVAVKVLHHQHSEDRTRLERFFRGARLMASLSHPGVVRVLEPRCQDDGFHYFVIERLQRDLHRAVRDEGLPTDEALRAVLAVADALHFAHGQQVIHRDVKPQNILLDGRGRAAITDFDLVKAADTTGGTRSGALGTFLYAAPEALKQGHAADARADVFSLGMTAIFCLHRADVPAEALYEREAFLAELPCSAEVRAVLQKATAIRPQQRFETVERFAVALREAMEGEQSVAPSAPAPAPRGYAGLTEELRRAPADRESLQLQFSELEQLVGHPLPAAARRERGWWANDGGEVSAAWLDAGWRVGQLNVSEGRVSFARLTTTQAQYIRFFGQVVRELNRMAPRLPVLDSPNGQSTHALLYLRAGADQVGSVRVAFDRSGQLRVEAYLDTGDQKSTKALFGLLLNRRVSLLAHGFGPDLSWDNLPENRASRIVSSLPGRMSDPSELRVQLAADTALRLYSAIQRNLDELSSEPTPW